MHHIGFFIDHHFAATSHFKGCHDGIGGMAKNAMRRREKFGVRIMGADGVVSYLKSFFREKGGEGEEGMRKYFAKWFPYRIRKVHVKLIGKNEIYRPGSELAGIDGTRDMCHFAGRNVLKHDAATTTEGLKEDAKLVLKRDGGGRPSREEKRRLAELDKEKIAVMKDKGGWADVEPEEPISGEEEVTVRKIKRRYPVRTRLASCFCSSCQISNYEECHVTRTYPARVHAFQDGEVKETVIMDTGVAPAGVDEPPAIKFGARKKECKIPRITGTQWEESDQDEARDLWENLGR